MDSVHSLVLVMHKIKIKTQIYVMYYELYGWFFWGFVWLIENFLQA